MVDDVRLFLPSEIPEKAIDCLEGVGPDRFHAGEWSGKLKNLRVSFPAPGQNVAVGQWVKVAGSLNKFWHGDNLTPMTRRNLQDSIECLSDSLTLPADEALVWRLDLACNFVMRLPVTEYTTMLETAPYLARDTVSDSRTVYFKNDKKTLLFYDKIAEMKSKGVFVPDDFLEKNILRYECRLTKRVNEQLKWKIKAGSLYQEKMYIRLIDLWKKNYDSVSKKREGCEMAFNGIRMMKDAALFWWIQNQGGEAAIIQKIDAQRQAGTVTKDQAKAMRQEVREVLKNPSIVKPSDAIKELDDKVRQAAIGYR
jgi:hypothetical protein